MIVRLTAKQIEVVRTAFAKARPWLKDVELLPGHKLTYDVDMPAVGWLHSLQYLLELTTGPQGGNKKGVAYSALVARRRIAAALHLYAAHPALYGMALYGRSTDVIPAWALPGAEEPGRLFDIFPVNGATFIHLVPQQHGHLTVWTATTVLPLDAERPSPLLESSHLQFARGAQRDEAASREPA